MFFFLFCNHKSAFGEHNGLVIVFDAHKSIENGFNVVYETTEHELCAFHLCKNLKENHKSFPIEDSFYSCVRAVVDPYNLLTGGIIVQSK